METRTRLGRQREYTICRHSQYGVHVDHGCGNTVFHPGINSPSTTPQGEHSFIFSTVSGIWPDGGDYVGLTADAESVFHPVWPDARSGSFQGWTARVAVAANDKLTQAMTSSDALNRALRPVFDPVRRGPAPGVYDIPVRIKNASTTAVCGPVFAVLAGTMFGASPPVIMNSSNGRQSIGAAFDYSRAFGDYECLAAGALSNAIVWTIKVNDASLANPGIPTFFRVRFGPTSER